jgi:dTDP-4-amino-4,6-dideoxygalactose transaminase
LEDTYSNYQSYSIYLKDSCPIERNELMQQFLDVGIATRRGVMTTHRETAYSSIKDTVALPVSEDLQDRSIILPLYIPMEQKDINFVIENFRSILQLV